jgi:hypothetical protein
MSSAFLSFRFDSVSSGAFTTRVNVVRGRLSLGSGGSIVIIIVLALGAFKTHLTRAIIGSAWTFCLDLLPLIQTQLVVFARGLTMQSSVVLSAPDF